MGSWERLLHDPVVQIAFAACIVILLIIPLMIPDGRQVRFTSKAPFIEIVDERPRGTTLRRRTQALEYAVDGRLEEEAVQGEDGVRPGGVARDSRGNLYVSDVLGHRVYQINTDGERKVFVGTGEAGYFGDSGPAIRAQLNAPRGLSIDSDDNLYIVDTGNKCVRKVVKGRIHTVAGDAGEGANSSRKRREGLATNVKFVAPTDVAVERDGTLYVGESPCNLTKADKLVWVFDPRL